MTNPDEFKLITCTLTNEQCYVNDCSQCERASEEEKEERLQEQKRLIPDKPMLKFNVEYLVNEHNTIGKFHIDIEEEDIIKVLKLEGKISKTITYDMRRLMTRWPHFVKVKNILSLGIPNQLKEIDTILFAYYDDFTYIAAPLWTDEDFKQKY